MKKSILIALLLFLGIATFLAADNVREIAIDGQTLKIGDTFDSLLNKIPRKYLIQESSEADPQNRNHRLYTQDYRIKDKNYRVVVGFSEDLYRVKEIISNPAPLVAKPKSETDSRPSSPTRSNPSSGCNTDEASRVFSAASQMGTFEDKSDRLIVRWGTDWSYLNKDQKLALLNTVADADACMTGQARFIFFYYYNKQVGKADPTWGIKLLD